MGLTIELLKESGLLIPNLVTINTPEMVKRYNACLISMGIKPTELTSFHLDKVGWSPEIAEEKKNNFYLSHDIANPTAIVVTPDQADAPVCFPCHSFDDDVMDIINKHLRDQISDLTCEEGICFNINTDMTLYVDVLDLLMIDSLNISATTPSRLIAKARAQQELIAQFKKDDNWADEEIRRRLIESAKLGDFRQRNFIINDLQYTKMKNFFSKAFGGVYVFRVLPTTEKLIITRDEKVAQEAKQDDVFAYWINNPELIDCLLELELISLDPEYYRDGRMNFLKWKKEYIVAGVLTAAMPEFNYSELGFASIKKNGYISQHADKLPASHREIERYERAVKMGQNPNTANLSLETKKILAYPSLDLAQSDRSLVWQMLSEIERSDIYHLFTHNKEMFFERYKEWPEAKKRWAIGILTNKDAQPHYVDKKREEEKTFPEKKKKTRRK